MKLFGSLFFIFFLLSKNMQAQPVSFQWVNKLKYSTTGEGQNVKTDNLGNVYVVGNFYTSDTDFDPGPGIYNLTVHGQDDVFVVKYDQNGELIWAKNLGGPKGDYAKALFIDNLGNIYVSGSFRDTADFDPGPNVFNLFCTQNMGDTDAFICKLDANGNFLWAKDFGAGISSDGGYILQLVVTII